MTEVTNCRMMFSNITSISEGCCRTPWWETPRRRCNLKLVHDNQMCSGLTVGERRSSLLVSTGVVSEYRIP